jgi:hypothetical protein
MKLADRVIETHSAGVRSESGFTIAQTSKMFKILSDSLYSDKVMAVIRELSTNAYDSHISAGNKNPFKVILPTSANPSFTVRDYGTGLSQADMENLYTTYGASNKNDSNDFVGCLGLGSKSPFAYTKSFTTSSYFNGTKYTYIAAIDDSGVPTLNLFNTCETDEANGLEISFAVKNHDFTEFTSKAIRIFHYFRMKPIIEGGLGNNLQDHKYSNTNIVISGNGWRVCRLNNDTQYYPNNYHRIDSGVVAIMGNIAYPVQTAQIIGQEKEDQPDHIAKWNRAFQKADIDSWKSFVTEIINSGLYLELDFGIGELEMDVSREGLQYTKSVIKSLRQKTQEIYLEMKDEFSKKISSAKTKIEAITTYYQMNELSGGWGVGASWTDPNGKSHNINSGSDLEYKMKTGKSLYVFNYKSSGYRSRRLISLTDRIHHDTLTGKGYSYWNSQKKNGKITFFVCDVKGEETAKKIVTRYCNQNDCFAYMIMDGKDHTQSDKGFDDLINDVGADNLLKVSDYKHLAQSSGPRKTGVRNSNGSVSDQDIFFIHGQSKDSGKLSVEYNDALSLKTLTSDELDELSDSDSIIYVPILRYQSTPEFPKINKIVSLFDNENIKGLFGDVKVYAIKSNFVAKMTSEGHNLVDFNTWFKKILSTKIKNYFNNTNDYNSMIEFYKKEFISKDGDNDNYYYSHGTLVSQFSCHMLSIFGLDYKKYIKNTELSNVIDSFLVMEFFADTMHRATFDLKRFSQTEYFDHINSLLKDRGIDNLDSKELKKKNVQYNTLINIQHQMFDHSDDIEAYTKLFKSDAKAIKYKLTKAADLKKILKVEVDKNPMLKYIMGSNQHNCNLRDLDSKNNPISQFADNYYGKRNNAVWVETMDSDKVDLFKIQLSSLIK